MNISKPKAIIPVIYVLVGLFYLFEPFLSSWFEIINPIIARNVFLPIDWMSFVIFLSLPEDLGFYFPDIFFALITLSYVVFFAKVVPLGWSKNQKMLAFLPLVILLVTWLVMTPLGLSYHGEKRLNSYVVGGWSRMILAGGADIIRADGLNLLNSPNEYPTDEEIPASIKKLGYWVKIEQDKKLLLVGLGQMFNMADEFGFIIYDAQKPLPLPTYLSYSEFYRIWKLDDGVYFFER